MKRVTHYAVVALIMLAVVSPALAQDTGAVTSAYERAFVTVVGVLIAVLGIGGYAFVKQNAQWGNVIISVLEFGVKLTPSTVDDAEVAKLRKAYEDALKEVQALKAKVTTVTGADVSRDEVEAEG